MEGLLSLVLDAGSYYPIHASITSRLDVADIFNLQLVYKEAQSLYSNLKRTQWNINNQLRFYFRDVVKFRTLQAETNTLIIEDFASRFFLRASRTNGDSDSVPILHLVAKDGSDCNRLHDLLLEENYSLKKQHAIGPAFSTCIRTAFRYEKTDRYGDPEKLINIRHAVSAPLEVALNVQYTTSRTCLISWNKAYCPFPVSMMLRNECYLLRTLRNRSERIRNTLINEKKNGLTVKTGLFKGLLDKGTMGHAELGPYRELGDKYSWIQDLDTTGISPSSQAPNILLDGASFSIGNPKSTQPISFLPIEWELLKSPFLKHCYIVCRTHDGHSSHSFELSPMRKMLNEAAVVQLMMLDTHKRPQTYASILGNPSTVEDQLRDFKLPSDWEFYDDDIQRRLGSLYTWHWPRTRV